MSKDNVVELNNPEAHLDLLTDLIRKGARQLIQQAFDAELQEHRKAHASRDSWRGVQWVFARTRTANRYRSGDREDTQGARRLGKSHCLQKDREKLLAVYDFPAQQG